MWEAIERNRRFSIMLISMMGILLLLLGAAIGASIEPQSGALLGSAAAIGIWLIYLITALAAGDRILLSSAGAHEIQKQDAPQLWNVVEEMSIASGLGAMPRIFIIEDYAPNAFAVGRKPGYASVAVTTGLLERLNRDELQGVIAHEIGHIVNLDIRFMTIAAVMMGSIAMISDVFLRSMRYSGRHIRLSRKGSGPAQLILLLAALALAILAPIFAQLLYFACSRRREYLADASGVMFTRYPAGLASALEKIAAKTKTMASANRAIAPLYIVNPLQGFSAAGLLSTHPPTDTRISILRSMGGGAGYMDYENAFRKVRGETSKCIGPRTLDASQPLAARAPSPEPDVSAQPQKPVEIASEVKDLLDRLVNYLLIPCPCGVRIKIPPDVKTTSITCPRCGRKQEMPTATAAPAAELNALPALSADKTPFQYRRKTEGWESFRCDCGHTLQLSPSFSGSRMVCSGCKERIEISK